jgi:hypothetical protein
MDVVRGDDVVENTEPIASSGFKQPETPMTTVFCKFKQELLLMAAMRYVPYVARWKIAMSARHDAFSLKQCFIHEKVAFKPCSVHYVKQFFRVINGLHGSGPDSPDNL